MQFGLGLSHLNLTLGLAGFVRGVSDIRVSIYTPRSSHKTPGEEALELFIAEMAGSSIGVGPTENLLGTFSSNPHLLERKYERFIGPLDISEFADANGRQATIQLSTAQLLLAAAGAQSKLDPASLSYESGWLFRPQHFYVLVEVNERRTMQQKAFQVGFGIDRLEMAGIVGFLDEFSEFCVIS